MANGLFGNMAAVAAQNQIHNRLNQAQLIGSLGPAGHGALAGLRAGGAINSLFGVQDPALAQAASLQQIGQEMESAGIEPGTPGFARQVYSRMLAAGFAPEQALKAFQQALNAEKTATDIAQTRASAPNPQMMQARANALMRMAQNAGRPMDAQTAIVLSQGKESFNQAVARLRKPAKEPDKVQTLRALLADPELMEAERKLRASGAIRLNLGDKPAAKADRDLVTNLDGSPVSVNTTPNDIVEGVASGVLIQKTPGQVAAENLRLKRGVEADISRERAEPILRAYIKALREGDTAFVLANQTKAGQAYARLRNPTGIVTDQDVALAVKDLPGLGSQAADALGAGLTEQSIRGIEAETGMRFGGERQQSGRFREGQTATNPQTGARIIFRNGQWQPM